MEEQEDLGGEVGSENIPAPFVMVPRAVLLDGRLHPSEFRVYSYLLARCGRKAMTWVGQVKIMKHCGLQRARLAEVLSKLKDLGLVNVENRAGKNTYFLPHVSKVYGEAAYFDWKEHDQAVDPGRTDVHSGRQPCPPQQTSMSTPPDTKYIKEVEEVDRKKSSQGSEELKAEIAACPAPTRDAVAVPGEVDPDAARYVAETKPHPLSGVFPSSTKSPDPKEARKHLYEQAKKERKEKVQAQREARKSAINITNVPDGVLAKDWEQRTCSTKFSEEYRAAMKLAGFEISARPNVAELAMWKNFLKRAGTIEKGVRVISAIISQWSELKKKFDTLNGIPGPYLFSSKWMDVLMDEALKRDVLAANREERTKKYGF